MEVISLKEIKLFNLFTNDNFFVKIFRLHFENVKWEYICFFSYLIIKMLQKRISFLKV